jgi:hypothetical protein
VIATGEVAGKRQRLILHALGGSCHPRRHRTGLVSATREALEQRLPKPVLDGLQPTERGRVIDPKRLRRAGESARPHDGEHQSQLVPVFRHRRRVSACDSAS